MARTEGTAGGSPQARGLAELRAARDESRGLYWAVGLFSLAVNLLMLTGPLYMLNVYDRVLGSRSVATLVALSGLVIFLYACMGLLDLVRGRIMQRVGAAFQARLDRRVFSASLRAPGLARAQREAPTALRDLEAVQRAITSPALMALFDLPFAPLFFAGIFLFHPWMGHLALGGAALLLALALLNQAATRRPLEMAARSAFAADQTASRIRTEGETIQALGMREAAFARWNRERERALETAIAAQDAGGAYSAIIKAVRLFLQSAMLGLGAYIVLRGEMTAGAMIAGSILLGRALAPIETIVGQWAVLARGREAWANLATLLGEVPEEPLRTHLPRPRGRLEVEQVTVVPPGESQATLRMVSFRVEPGQAVGVIGVSGAGKSTLARAITGAWRPAAGKIRLDGAALDQYDPDTLGRHIGYLPQRVTLFEGTIKENIARLSPVPDDAAVVRAAQAAAAHEMILRLPEGYDTRVDSSGGRLSGGQIQRIGLARALYGDPVLVVLDEPNSNLDNDGSMAVNAAIRGLKERGAAVLIMAHRPAAIAECDLLLMLENGTRRAFGPKEDVLREIVQNHRQIIQAGPAGGVA
ncbi:type I secretion system ABC transporter, PrtD family [Rubellimicrobium thermophilum DSM 16684]|uniref:Type I secretion system ABC transporter, PrtD family n=1 Tax=Rubellimicrobium thermophilum DSM 16684 TaxID=1123069 RepID=S9QZ04_9RHOB|nr:type I secretion system permease/ATPase [Rubellimicrobium thermophilum]EPX84893.1 type I secretion system ABC transporter, PrtD family [Rubellimicrobium thermophilum DSM 16684]